MNCTVGCDSQELDLRFAHVKCLGTFNSQFQQPWLFWETTQPAIICSKLVKTLGQSVKYVQS